MEVVIAGAGSIGLLIGSYLAESGWKVTFFVRRQEQAERLRQQGIRRINGHESTIIGEIGAETDIRNLSKEVLWIIAVKSGGVTSLVQTLIDEDMESPILFVQNGFSHFEMVSDTSLPVLFFATIEHGAARIDDSTVSHNGIGMMKIAPYRGNNGALDLMKQSASSSFPIEFVTDAKSILFRKVLINCMINPLTAILQIRNGELLENTYAKKLFDELYEEIMNVFPEMRSDLPKSAVEEVCFKTRNNESSMLKDRLLGKQMEIDTIVTALLRMADERGKGMPLMKILENLLRSMNRS